MYSRKVRLATVAGKFYERVPGLLRNNINSFLEETPKNDLIPEDAIVQAIIVPHAGYPFSGKTAAKTFATASNAKNKPDYKRIIVIAPSHYVGFTGLALPTYEACSTPLGDISVDTKSIDKLSNKNFTRNDNAHAHEHSLEVELPFIQTLFPKIPIMPFVCGHIDSVTAKDIAKTLLPFWNSETLWVISSDFTHYGHQFNYVPFSDNIPENLKNLDFGAIDKILDFDLTGFDEYLHKTNATICGRNPIMAMLATAELAENRSLLKAKLIDYTTSGELTGDYNHTVSYAGIAIYV
jgi:MEMO1 family protein